MLAAYPDRDVRVLVVWFNMVRSDARDRWPTDEIVDPRAVHFWDEEKLVGRALAERPELADWRPVVWDAWLLYPPGVTWNNEPPEAEAEGRTIIGAREELDQVFRALPVPTASATRPRGPSAPAP